MIRKRNDGWQYDVTVNGRRYRKTYKTEIEARAAEAKVLADEAASKAVVVEPAKPSSPALKTVSADAFARFWAGTRNEKEAKRVADVVVESFGSTTPVDSLTSSRVDEFVAKLRAKQLAPGTINRHLSSLRRVLKFAATRGYIAAVPHIEQLKEGEGRLRYYSVEEERAALAACVKLGLTDMQDLIVVLADGGCRLGEALRLTPADRLASGVRFPKTKSGKPRMLPMTGRLRLVLERRAAGRGSRDLLFPGWDKKRASVEWGKVKAEAWIDGDDAVLHTWRHTCASRLVQARVPIQEVQKWLGHATVAMTLKYAHLAPDSLEPARAALETFASQNPVEKTPPAGDAQVTHQSPTDETTPDHASKSRVTTAA